MNAPYPLLGSLTYDNKQVLFLIIDYVEKQITLLFDVLPNTRATFEIQGCPHLKEYISVKGIILGNQT